MKTIYIGIYRTSLRVKNCVTLIQYIHNILDRYRKGILTVGFCNSEVIEYIKNKYGQIK